MLHFALLIVGFILLIKGADVFVDASVGIARVLKIPNIIIGLTIVAWGTSAPEFVVTIAAAMGGSNSMAIGNVVGSNVFNLMFVLGLAAFIKPFAVRFHEISRDYWISVVAALVLLVAKIVADDYIHQIGGFIFLGAFALYIFLLIRKGMKQPVEEVIDDNIKPLPLSILFSLIGMAMIIFGGQLTVDNAVSIALGFGIEEWVVGLTILAIGTSLPELVTTLVACKKGENDVALGNVVGSNVFNILLILGLAGSIAPLAVDVNLIFDLAVLIVGSLLIVFLAKKNQQLARLHGFSLFVLYIAYMIFLTLNI